MHFCKLKLKNNSMKKLSLVFAIVAAVAFASCNSETTTSETVTDTTTVDGTTTTTTTTTTETTQQPETTVGQRVDTAIANTKEAAKEAAHDVKTAAQKGAKKV